MTKEEARVQMELLKLRRKRINAEIETVHKCFCGRGDHYFLKVWGLVERGGRLFRVIARGCILCSIRQPLEISVNRCPVCDNSLEIYETIGYEDVGTCSYCGFVSSSGILGISIEKIPPEDIKEIK